MMMIGSGSDRSQTRVFEYPFTTFPTKTRSLNISSFLSGEGVSGSHFQAEPITLTVDEIEMRRNSS